MDEETYSAGETSEEDEDITELEYYQNEFSEDDEDDDNNDNEFDEEDTSLAKSELNFIKLKIISNDDTYSKYITKERKTSPYLTKFEKTRVLGLRATQLEGGAKTLLEKENYKGIRKSIDIATIEFERGVIPFIVRRYLPNGQYEDWKLNDFQNIYSS